MHGHRRCGGERGHVQPECLGRLVEHITRHITDDKRAAIELLASGVKRLFRCLEVRVPELIAERRECVVGVVVDRKHGAGAIHATRCGDRARHRCHRNLEDHGIYDTRCLHGERFRERPPRVVVRVFLRIVRAPVLIVENCVGDSRVRLVHPNDVRACRELALLRCWRARRIWRSASAWCSTAGCSVAPAPSTTARRCSRATDRHRHRELGGGARNLHRLLLQHAQQVHLRSRARVVGGEHICSGAFRRRLENRPLTLFIEVAQQLQPVVGREAERREQSRLLVVVVVPKRPFEAPRYWRILSPPIARGFVR